MKTSFRKGRENKFYIALLLTTTLLFVVFFTSKLWMYDDTPVMQTPFNVDITGLEQSTLKLKKWEYNPDKELMEVTIETIHTGSDVIKPTFSFKAKEREATEEYPVKIVYEDDTNIVVQIKNVPETYRIIGLFVYEHRDKKILENEAKEQMTEEGSYNQDDSEVKLTLAKPAEKIIVGDYRMIKLNNSLVTRDALDYQIENVEREMNEVKKQIEVVVKEKIPFQDELIASLKNEIEALENEIEFQTDEEEEETVQQITSKKEAIKEAEKEKEELQLAINKLKDKYEKLQEKLHSISEGKEKSKEKSEQKNEQNDQKANEENKKDDGGDKTKDEKTDGEGNEKNTKDDKESEKKQSDKQEKGD